MTPVKSFLQCRAQMDNDCYGVCEENLKKQATQINSEDDTDDEDDALAGLQTQFSLERKKEERRTKKKEEERKKETRKRIFATINYVKDPLGQTEIKMNITTRRKKNDRPAAQKAVWEHLVPFDVNSKEAHCAQLVLVVLDM